MKFAEAAGSFYFYHHNQGNLMSKFKWLGWLIFFQKFLNWHTPAISGKIHLCGIVRRWQQPWPEPTRCQPHCPSTVTDVSRHCNIAPASDWEPSFYSYLWDMSTFPLFSLWLSWKRLWFLSRGRLGPLTWVKRGQLHSQSRVRYNLFLKVGFLGDSFPSEVITGPFRG